MATVAVGDIHGNLAALDDLLERLLPGLRPEDELVFLGDYVDRGPDARGCLERLLRLETDASCRVVTLLGNHEEWLLATLDDPTKHSWIVGMEGLTTVASYSKDAADLLRREIRANGPRLVLEKLALPYQAFFDAVPRQHLDFLRRLVRFHRSRDVVCVHGGLDPLAGPVEAQEPSSLTWGTVSFPDDYAGSDPIVYGHRNDAILDDDGWPRPRLGANRTFGIDTIAHGVLTAMRFPGGEVIQTRRFGT